MTARYCAFFLATLLISSTVPADSVREVRFSGVLSRSDSSDEERILRNFEAIVLQGKTSFFGILDDERNGCPWPESFGVLGDQGIQKPHLIYEYDGSTYTLPLPDLIVNLPADISLESTWTDGSWAYEVDGADVVNGISAWELHARERRGRQQSLVVDAESGQLLMADLDVFMGQGEKFLLSVRQTSNVQLDDDRAMRLPEIQSALLALQSSLNRRPGIQLSELSSRQIRLAKEKLNHLTAIAKQTPLEESVLRIRRDVEQQERRVNQSMVRQQELRDRPTPPFVLSLVAGGTLESNSLKGKVTVLHFWNYAEKPLSEPYGQVGYLEFLYGKRRQLGIEVVGVATNTSLQQSDQLNAGRRTVRKLIEFMNLTYPVGYDDGSLLRSLGDPRKNGASLPLWVVVSKSGKVVHYQSGFYEIDRKLGLKELDEILVQLAAESPK